MRPPVRISGLGHEHDPPSGNRRPPVSPAPHMTWRLGVRVRLYQCRQVGPRPRQDTAPLATSCHSDRRARARARAKSEAGAGGTHARTHQSRHHQPALCIGAGNHQRTSSYPIAGRSSAMNRPTPAHHRGMPPPPQLARYGSAPGSFLAALADSVARGGGGAGADAPASQSQQRQHQQGAAVVSRFFSGESSGLTSCESTCRTDAAPPLQRAYGGSGEIHVPPPPPAALPQQRQPGLLRHSSSPAGLLSRLMADPHGNGNGGMGGMGGGGMGSSYPHNADAMGQHRRLSSQWRFSRQQQQQDMMPHISEMRMSMPTQMPMPMPPADVADSVSTGNGTSSDLSRTFSMTSWDDTNSNSIMFSAPGGKKAKVLVDADDGMVTSFSNIDSQFGLSSSSLEMPGMDDYMQMQDSVACRVRAKRGCATHPRSIAERERRTRISKRLRRLQDLVPNMDKQTNTSDMLDIAVDYIKVLQDQIEKLKQDQGNCSCSADQKC